MLSLKCVAMLSADVLNTNGTTACVVQQTTATIKIFLYRTAQPIKIGPILRLGLFCCDESRLITRRD